MSTISGDRNSVSFNLQKFEYKGGKIDKREMAKAVFKMAKEGDQEASAIVNQFKSVEGLYNAIKDKMGGAANAVENLFSNVPLNLFKPKFLSKNKWKINTKALKDYVAERRTLKRDEKTVSNEMQPNASLPKVQTEQQVLSPEVKEEQSTPDPVQTPVIDTQSLGVPEPIDTKQKAIDILENIQNKTGIGGQKSYCLALTLPTLSVQCNEFLRSIGTRGKLLQSVGDSVKEKKIQANVYFQCQNLLREAEAEIGETGIYSFDFVLLEAGKEVQKINEKIQELNKIAETGEGDVDACEHAINESLNDIDVLFKNKMLEKNIPLEKVEGMPMQILKIANEAFDEVIKLVGEENKDTIEALRNEFNQNTKAPDVKTE